MFETENITRVRARLYDLDSSLPPSYLCRANFSLISLKKSTNRLHENRKLVNSPRGGGGGGVGGLRQLRWASFLPSARRVTLATRDNSQRSRCHVMSIFKVLNQTFTLKNYNFNAA